MLLGSFEFAFFVNIRFFCDVVSVCLSVVRRFYARLTFS